MAIIGFYLSPGSCHLAWHYAEQFYEQVYELEPGQTHAGVLTGLVQKILTAPPQVIATTTGPGSFTSIRIQLATAIGLKIGYGAQLFCPNTLDVLEHAGHGAIPCIDSFRSDYFVKIGGAVTCKTEPELRALESQGQKLCGNLGQSPKNLAVDLVKYHLANPHLKILDKPEPYYVKTPEYKTRANFKR